MILRRRIVCWIGGLCVILMIVAVAVGYTFGASDVSKLNPIILVIAVFLLLVMVISLTAFVGQLISMKVEELLAQAAATSESDRLRDEEARNQLVSDAAHELRTPVAILRGHMETMLTGAEEMKLESLHPLLDETKRMTRLIQDLQQLNLAEAGKLKLDCSWILFQDLIREVVDIFAIEAEEKETELQYIGEGNDEVYCDPTRVKQVLINLIGNAIRYVPEKGKVEVCCLKEKMGTIRVEVADDGPGIPEDKLPYLFHRFYRADDSRNRGAGGTGLGLAIAKQFVEAHGGNLSVTSDKRTGTVFVFQLPMFPDF